MGLVAGQPIGNTWGVSPADTSSDLTDAEAKAPALTGPWDFDAIIRHLETTRIPIRLATMSPRGPAVQSLWFEYRSGSLWCATQSDALVVSRLRRDPSCGFEIAGDQPPYHGVRGFGVAEILTGPGPEILERLLNRYEFADTKLANWLMSRADDEVAIRIRPTEIASWDFRGRM